jgi:hypothetical protein
MVRLSSEDEVKNNAMVFERHGRAVMAYKVDDRKLLSRALLGRLMLAEIVKKSSGDQRVSTS